jgi:hypothetical protein
MPDGCVTIQNAHMIWVEPVGPLARLPVKNKIRHFSDFNGLNWLNGFTGSTINN